MKFVFSEIARQTLRDIILYYRDIDRQYVDGGSHLAEQVYLDVNNAIGRLLLFPQQGTLFDKTERVYRLNLNFNLGLFYVFDEKFVKVVAIVDLRRDVSQYKALIQKSDKL